MFKPKIPSRKVIGRQLALGVNGPALPLIDRSNSWITAQDQNLDPKILNWKIVSGPVKVGVEIDAADPSSFLDTASHLDRIIPHSSSQSGHDIEQIQHEDDLVETDTDLDSSDDSVYQFSSGDYNNAVMSGYYHNNVKVFKDVRKDLSKSEYFPYSLQSGDDYLNEKQTLRTINQLRDSMKVENLKPNTKDEIKYLDSSIGDVISMGLIQTSYLSKENIEVNILAYSTGESQSYLSLSLFDIESNSENSDNIDRGHKALQTNIVSVNLKSKIKCIKFPVLSQTLGRFSDLVGIITENSFFVLKIISINFKTGNIDYTLYNPIHSNKFSDFPLADVAFNPWNMHQFALIDIKGNWAVGSIPNYKQKNSLKISNNFKGSIFQPNQLTNLKKIFWSSTDSRIMIMNSNGLTEIDFLENWQMDIAEAITWSEFLDLKKINESWSVLLTSKEIILLSHYYNKEINRELSWKHDLIASDRSYRLSLQKLSYSNMTLIVIFIYSRLHNTVYCHGFTINDQIVQSVGNGSLLVLPDIISGVATVSDSERNLDCYLDSDNNDISLNLLVKGMDSKTIYNYSIHNDISTEGTDNASATGNVQNKIGIHEKFIKQFSGFDDSSVMISLKMLEKCKNIVPPDYQVSSDEQTIAKVGYQLSENMNIYLAKRKENGDLKVVSQLLFSLTEANSSYFQDVYEFTSLLDQFFNYYINEDVSFTNVQTVFNILLYQLEHNTDDVYKKLYQCWKETTSQSEVLTTEIIKDVIKASVVFNHPQEEQQRSSEIYSKLSPGYREVFDTWDEPIEELDIENTQMSTNNNLSQFTQRETQSQIPTIVSTQSQAKSSKRKPNSQFSQSQSSIYTRIPKNKQNKAPENSQLPNVLPNNMTPAFTLLQTPPFLSSPSPSTLSQSQAGSQTRNKKNKKKKRKIGGFG